MVGEVGAAHLGRMQTSPNVPRLPVFYRDEMTARAQSYSPSAEKPRQVLRDWLRRELPLDVRAPSAATVGELSLAHAPDFVRGVLSCRLPNGFGNKSPEVAASLPYTSGSMLSAARWVLAHGGVACSPTSGFHHAGYQSSGGFCTFNGLAVTALALHRAGLVRSVAILDCDHHYGDGTDDILERLGLDWVHHFTAGATFGARRDVPAFFARLEEELARAATADLVLYQAGADPHVRDPLGGWLTTEELRARDALVFGRLAAAATPVVWNLAGGYQREPDGSIPRVLEIHAHTAMEALAAGFVVSAAG